ncbi:hypothetical protein F2P81_018711 [Scophthalmus maximus]|uniref:Uncharacterized protein n=1 Tax=Scophthalmus maximus TaxID=52904 RepID=A0A6A4S320_SCOMX|nr:hypothetical protein F2P81_018711 [Scophthalmus maximus]
MRFSTAPPRVRRLVGCEILEQIEREKKKRCTLCFLHKSTPYTKVERLTDIPRKFARKKNGNYSRPPSSYSLGYLGGHTSLLLICSVRKGHMIEDDSSRSNHGDSPSLSVSLTEHSISQPLLCYIRSTRSSLEDIGCIMNARSEARGEGALESCSERAAGTRSPACSLTISGDCIVLDWWWCQTLCSSALRRVCPELRWSCAASHRAAPLMQPMDSVYFFTLMEAAGEIFHDFSLHSGRITVDLGKCNLPENSSHEFICWGIFQRPSAEVVTLPLISSTTFGLHNPKEPTDTTILQVSPTSMLHYKPNIYTKVQGA